MLHWQQGCTRLSSVTSCSLAPGTAGTASTACHPIQLVVAPLLQGSMKAWWASWREPWRQWERTSGELACIWSTLLSFWRSLEAACVCFSAPNISFNKVGHPLSKEKECWKGAAEAQPAWGRAWRCRRVAITRERERRGLPPPPPACAGCLVICGCEPDWRAAASLPVCPLLACLPTVNLASCWPHVWW